MMRVFPDWRYMHAYIGVCVPSVARVSDEELENAVVHELVHILVNEMQKKDQDHEERAVTLTTKAILFVRDLTAKEYQEKDTA
jgi:predicted SprT family Zn-dependent metalloprotease